MKIRSKIESVKRRGAVTVRRACIETLEDRRLLSFSPAVNYAAGHIAQAVLTADFNNDTRLDLAVVNFGSSDVSVLLGNANGTFQAAVNSATGTNPLSVAVGDFNADGKLDLVTANANSGVGEVSVLLGNGNGTFRAPSSIGIGSSPTSVAVGDFNRDGKLDLAVTSNIFFPGSWGYWGYYPGFSTGQINVLLGNGAGSFAASPTTPTDLGQGHAMGASLGDFNRDGILDLATLNHEYGSVRVLLGNGIGTFGGPTAFNTGWYPQALTVGDFTGDGILDLVTVGQSIDILPGIGDGTFRPVVRQYVDPVAVAAADFNGDGKLDIVTADGGNLNVLLGLGTGALTSPLNHDLGVWPASVATGDFNKDGRPDVASANSSGDNVSVLLNNGLWPATNAPTITISDAAVSERNLGPSNATFTVSLSAASTQTVSVHYATADGSATVAAGDYQAVSGTLTFAPGQTSKTVTVLINGDRVAESSESLSLLLSNPVNAFVADAAGIGTITDDEPRVSIDYGAVWVAEGNTGTTNAVFTVRLAASYDLPVTVNFSTVEGDTDFPAGYWGYYGYYASPPVATSNSDFQAKAGTITFNPGETVKTIPIAIYGDRIGETGEYFSVNLGTSPSGAIIGSAHAVGVIADDEPSASISSTSVMEGNTGTTTMNFTVTLSAAPTAPVTVHYATTDGSATLANNDYQAKTGTLTFGIGEASKTFSVLVNGDRLAEYDEYFQVNLTGATGAVLGYNIGYGNIVDNEPRVSINSVSVTEGNSGTKLMTFTVSLAAVYDQTVTVNYATHDDSARVGGNDYVAKSGTLTFAPGQTTKTFTVTIKGDKQKEYDESFYVLLSGASSNAVISNAYGWGTILSDEPGRR